MIVGKTELCLNIRQYAFEFWQIFDWFWGFFRVNNVHIKSEKLIWTSHLKENWILSFKSHIHSNKLLKIEVFFRHRYLDKTLFIICIKSLAQWYRFGFAFQRTQVRACYDTKTFFLIFMSILGALKVRILVKMALFPQPSAVMPPAFSSFSWTVINALERRITAQYRKWVKFVFFCTFLTVLVCKK